LAIRTPHVFPLKGVLHAGGARAQDAEALLNPCDRQQEKSSKGGRSKRQNTRTDEENDAHCR
jgi:hypothetical protein